MCCNSRPLASTVQRFAFSLLLATAGLSTDALAQAAAPAAPPQAPAAAAASARAPRYANEIAAYLEQDKVSPPPTDGILFVGSSIFRLWTTLEQQMAPLPVFNRGFGGSRTDEVLFYMDRIVLPYRPRVIVYYCGSNDVNAGDEAAVIAGRVQEFARRVGAALPKTTIYFVSVNKAPQKRDRWDVVEAVNRAMQDYASRAPNLKYIDVNPVLFDAQGEPRLDMYVSDRLHLTPPAYAGFTDIIKPILLRAWNGGQ